MTLAGINQLYSMTNDGGCAAKKMYIDSMQRKKRGPEKLRSAKTGLWDKDMSRFLPQKEHLDKL